VAKGASVTMAARRHNVNPNQVFVWRRQHRRGLLSSEGAKDDAKLLPINVSTPTVLPTERAAFAAGVRVLRSLSKPRDSSRSGSVTVTALWCAGVWMPMRSRV